MKIKLGLENEYRKHVEENSKDFYSKGVIVYSEKWANLMEEEIAKGKKIKDIAQETSYKADTLGITGFMYGCAISVLAHFWEYGEELRKWHNLDIQIHNEGEKANENGGVLNPAIVNINV